MEASNKENEIIDKCYEGIEKRSDEWMLGESKQLKIEEQWSTANETKISETDLEISNSGPLVVVPNLNKDICLHADGKKKRDRVGCSSTFEFHFPEELWLIILTMVEDADRVNCCRALPYLSRILHESKSVFLAEQVFPLLGDYLSKNELLDCRQVCKKWNAGVAKVMSLKHTPTLCEEAEQLYKFSNLQEVELFMGRFIGHNRSPFIDGAVHLVDRDEGMDYPVTVLQFLRQFGRHIRKLVIEDFCEVLDPYNWYGFLQEALTFTPNLSHLEIIEHDLFENEAEPTTREVMALNNHMVRNPMPFIRNLEVVRMQMEGVPTEAVQHVHTMLLLPYASQIKTLGFLMSYWREHYAPRLVNIQNFIAFNVESNENLERISHLTGPLRLLKLYATGSLEVAGLLQVIKKFPTLDNVTIEFQGSNNKLSNVSFFDNITVPSLKSLQIINGGTLSYNFLQMFTGILRLHLEIDPAMDIVEMAKTEGKDDLQLFKVLGDSQIYESSIWKLLPSLEYAKIQYQGINENCGTQYGTRGGYDEYLATTKYTF